MKDGNKESREGEGGRGGEWLALRWVCLSDCYSEN